MIIILFILSDVVFANNNITSKPNYIPSHYEKKHFKLYRVPLTIVPKISINTVNKDGSKKVISKDLVATKHTLLVKMSAVSHFYLDKYHVVFLPRKWQEKTRSYGAQVDLYHRYGEVGAIEEFIGSVSLQGYISGTNDTGFEFRGYAHKIMTDRQQKAVVSVSLGHQQLAIVK